MKNGKEKRIYLDYMASTPVDARVKESMAPFWSDMYGHPWSLHSDGLKANKAIKESLNKTSSLLDARPSEIIFTSGGTESTTQAIKGLVEFIEDSNGDAKGLHIIVSAIEHPSVGGVVDYAKDRGMEVTTIGIDQDGLVDLKEFREALRPETVLVSIMYANSEIGTIQPIKEISKIIKSHRKNEKNAFMLPNLDFKFPAFHTDASQAALYLDCSTHLLGVDMMTLDGHKMYGPKGVGLLYVRDGILLKPLFFGHSNKSYVRHGTPPVPLIVGFAKSLEIAVEERDVEGEKVTELRNYFIDRVLEEIPKTRLNGDRDRRLPHNASISIEGISHEFLMIQLDGKGISVATRSACSAIEGDKSPVLEKLFDHTGESAIRFSFGKETTKEEIDLVIKALQDSLKIA